MHHRELLGLWRYGAAFELEPITIRTPRASDINCYLDLKIQLCFWILAFPALVTSLPSGARTLLWRTKMHPILKSSIGVLIADDSAAFCRLIATMLQKERSTHIVGIAGNLEDALHFAVQYTPDVLLLDLHLDDLAGHDPLSVKIGFLSCVRSIIAMSTRTDQEERQFAQLYGASRLVDKFFLSEQLIPTIRSCGHPKRPLIATPPHQRAPRPTRFAF